MNTYFYRILVPPKRLKVGVLRLAVTQDLSARQWLEAHYDATVLTLVRLPGAVAELGNGMVRLFRSPLPMVELAGFLRDLGVMTRSGIPLQDALKAIAEERGRDQRRVAHVARLILAELDAGATTSAAFARYPELFPETVRNLVVIGDETGALDRMLLEAAKHIERLVSITRDVRRALIYPAFVFASIIGAALFWIYYVIPNLSELFDSMQLELPALTRGLLAFSDWAEENALSSLVGLVAGVAALIMLVRYHLPTRRFAHRLAHRIPILRVIVTASGMAYIAENLALLVRAGVDLLGSLNVLERSLADQYYKERFSRMRDLMANGEMLSAAMRRVGGFPPMAVRMINVGEESGALDQQLSYLAEEYRARLDYLVSSLAEILKPVIIIFAGGLFILLIVALLLPIYELVRQAAWASTGG
ncbi:MAG: type II secretion system F family protein [Halothiobacillaceae bacterium]